MIDFTKWYKEKGGKSIITSLRFNKDIKEELIDRTSFLSNNASNSERVFILINDIKNKQTCPYCEHNLKFHKLNKGYHGTCQSKDCVKKHRSVVNKESSKKINWDESLKKQKETNIKRYGKDHVWCNGTKPRETYRNTMKQLYGKDSPLKVKSFLQKMQTTSIDRYGSLDFLHCEKTLQTIIKRYPDALNEKTGRINIMTSKEGHQIWEDSIFVKYGVRNPLQVKEIFEKQQKNSFRLKEFKDTNIFYRGSYELDFLQNFHLKIKILESDISPNYLIENDEHIYIPDFYIPSHNLIIEIKSSYYYSRDKPIIIEKAKSVLKLGYEFMIIIDKDYSFFEKYCNL